jgi:hypothetical protein
MGTAEKSAMDFHSVTNHLALAMFANGRDGLDCALEAVECMPCAGCDQVETLVILIPTHFTSCHFELLSGVAVET